MAKAGCERILLLPLYPQYAAATTATVCDAAFATLAAMRDQPTLRVVPPYYDEPVYIEALADSIEADAEDLAVRAGDDPGVVPRHPEILCRRGRSLSDAIAPRPCGCCASGMKLDETKLMLTFQSRFGRAEWLQPYTDKTVEALAQRGVKSLAVVTPGFSADCLETLEEIAVENARYLQGERRREFCRDPVSQRQRGRDGGDLATGAARAARLDLRAETLDLLGGMSMFKQRRLPIAFAVALFAADPALSQDGAWTMKQPLPAPRNEVALAAVGGKLYVVGGSVGGEAVPLIDEYDPPSERLARRQGHAEGARPSRRRGDRQQDHHRRRLHRLGAPRRGQRCL